MKRTLLCTAAVGLLALGAAPALADCREELDALRQETGIIKDGTTAPMSTVPTPQTGDTEGGMESGAAEGIGAAPMEEGEVAKTGDVAPLETDPSHATSAQDAQAQSLGGETAAEQAEDEGVDTGKDTGAMAEGEEMPDTATSRQVAIQRAIAALQAGDEEACLQAVEEARSM